jgi:hypothetical protein
MKSIKHYLYQIFLKDTGATRPNELELDMRMCTPKEVRLVQLEFNEPVTKLMLLSDEARDLANSLYELAHEARVED